MKLPNSGYQTIPDHAAGSDAPVVAASNETSLELAPSSSADPRKSTFRCRDFALGTIFGATFALVLAVCISGGSHLVKLAFQPRHWHPVNQQHANTVRGHHASSQPHVPSKWHKFFRPQRHTKVSIGPRPYFLLSQMDDDDPLKQVLGQCADRIDVYRASDFVLGHRGAALQFPEHTYRSHDAASRMGAGLVECDVALTKDQLAKKCTVPFKAATKGANAKAQCCTTDFTLEEIQSLCGKMHSYNSKAKTPRAYVGNTPGYQTDLYSHDCPHIQSHEDYIATVDANGGSFVPEFKMLDYDFTKRKDGYTREMFLQQVLDDYKGIHPSRVFPQGFTWEDMYYVAKHTRYGENSFALDKNMATIWYTKQQLRNHFAPLVANGVPAVAPAIFMLLEVNAHGKIVPSLYGKVAKEMGLEIIAWTLERSDALSLGGGWYYSTISDALEKDSDMLNVLDILYEQVGIKAIFTDWAATVTFYANCKNVLIR